jgi:hypothetical protein
MSLAMALGAIVFAVLFALAVTEFLPPHYAISLVLALALAGSIGGLWGVALCAAGLGVVAAGVWFWGRRPPQP